MGRFSSAEPAPAAGAAASARDPGIDALRGLAIVLVVLHHLGLRIPLKKTALGEWLPGWLLGALNWNGYEAVFVFFVISGFLIAGNALRRWGGLGRIDLGAFYARRFARIVPCLLALVAVLSVLHGLGGDPATGVLWYLPALSLCWLLGAAVARFLSTPCERWLRVRLAGTTPGRAMRPAEAG
ncbi:acyltransferase family protein [Frateuria defendens]|uniref:acyltransferase family protein n=1 Tax=Frateuria defendens TaxID=2219559 RepID=UPI00069D48E2|nr:acyltransferase family protein [Frateuria defendens]